MGRLAVAPAVRTNDVGLSDQSRSRSPRHLPLNTPQSPSFSFRCFAVLCLQTGLYAVLSSREGGRAGRRLWLDGASLRRAARKARRGPGPVGEPGVRRGKGARRKDPAAPRGWLGDLRGKMGGVARGRCMHWVLS